MGQQEMSGERSTVVAVSTPVGNGGIAVIRMSGPHAVDILSSAWKGACLQTVPSHTAHMGWILDGDGEPLDQIVATVFRAPNSYTGEDVVEISCHGSLWIQKAIVGRMVECGAEVAGAGEFTRRAFLNGRIDLAQAEGVADLIGASSRAAARLAATQLKGDFSRSLEGLRRQMVDLGVLLELELDFSEEDVEFADRSRLISLAKELRNIVGRLAMSFKAGNAFKTGVPVVFAGVPNAGKSTLLNALVGEEKAIVTDEPGTTRDVIEDMVEISGILFRFTDTAGLRESTSKVEMIGVEKAKRKIADASIVIYLIDPTQDVRHQFATMASVLKESSAETILVSTKSDLPADMGVDCYISDTLDSDTSAPLSEARKWEKGDYISISARAGEGVDELKEKLVAIATGDFDPQQEMIVTNVRHYDALRKACEPLDRLIEGLECGISSDFLAQDLREADRCLGEITGSVSSSEILHTIFSRFCIGK